MTLPAHQERTGLVRALYWDIRVNLRFSLDGIRAVLLLIEVRLEQAVYAYYQHRPGILRRLIWTVIRGMGSLFQWSLYQSKIPGSMIIGRGLRIPHPQNILIAGGTAIGEFCTIYQNTTIARNGFLPSDVPAPRIGNYVLIGTGAILLGSITVGSDVLIGAGAVVTHDVPTHSRVTLGRPVITPRCPTEKAAQPASARHLKDPYSIWR